MPDTIDILFDENDHRNGHSTGHFEQVHIDGLELWIEGPETRLRTLSACSVRISRRKFRVESSAEWVGNWCWNSYEFRHDVAVSLLVYLADRGFTPHCAPSEVMESWSRPDLRSVLAQAIEEME